MVSRATRVISDKSTGTSKWIHRQRPWCDIMPNEEYLFFKRKPDMEHGRNNCTHRSGEWYVKRRKEIRLACRSSVKSCFVLTLFSFFFHLCMIHTTYLRIYMSSVLSLSGFRLDTVDTPNSCLQVIQPKHRQRVEQE